MENGPQVTTAIILQLLSYFYDLKKSIMKVLCFKIPECYGIVTQTRDAVPVPPPQ